MSNNQKYALIYNPNAGRKRHLIPNPFTPSLEDIKHLLTQYQLTVDFFPTEYPGHAKELAQKAAQENYKAILVAGGDGTVGEAANGLVDSDTPLGILPIGSVMNVARMLNIPLDVEKAIMLLKIGRTRKIDLGMVTEIDGKQMPEPYYFIESAGIGLEAQLHEEVLNLERGHLKALFDILKTLFDFYGYPGSIIIDDKIVKTRATIVAISNGPFTANALEVAPTAKLNDHRLTVSLFKMSKWELFNYFMMLRGKAKRKYTRKVDTYIAKHVRIESKIKRLVHADARLYGQTPVEFTIKPSALTVIAGFPTPDESSLVKRTLLDP